MNSGQYDRAISDALDKLKRNPDKKGKQGYVLIVETAFKKATERDQERIKFLSKENSNTSLQERYETYLGMQRRQDKIIPILPLKVLDENREAQFNMVDYSDDILSTKGDLTQFLYASALKKTNAAVTKNDFRSIYNDLEYLNNLKPNYKDVKEQMDDVRFKGTSFVKVSLFNDSEIALPVRLENELLDFSAYDLNNFWTEYHSVPERGITYDRTMEIAFNDIQISPERIKEREVVKEKQVIDGTEFLLDEDGNKVLDENGDEIEIDKLVTVRGTYFEWIQNKAVNVGGTVTLKQTSNGQTLESFPIQSEFIFDHRYAKFSGDRRAIEDSSFEYTRNKRLPFPSNEQMIYDAGTDVKERIKAYISRKSM